MGSQRVVPQLSFVQRVFRSIDAVASQLERSRREDARTRAHAEKIGSRTSAMFGGRSTYLVTGPLSHGRPVGCGAQIQQRK